MTRFNFAKRADFSLLSASCIRSFSFISAQTYSTSVPVIQVRRSASSSGEMPMYFCFSPSNTPFQCLHGVRFSPAGQSHLHCKRDPEREISTLYGWLAEPWTWNDTFSINNALAVKVTYSKRQPTPPPKVLPARSCWGWFATAAQYFCEPGFVSA